MYKPLQSALILLSILFTPIAANAQTPIKGTNVASVDRMYNFVLEQNSSFDRAIAQAFIDISPIYGIRGDIAFCQSIIETGWFRFEGGTAMTPEDHNYCGLGCTSLGVKGQVFDTIEDGVRAQMQHLYAYCCTDPIPAGETVIDERFYYVSRGCAPTWEGLSNTWAMNDYYGSNILSMYNDLMSYSYNDTSLSANVSSVSLSGYYGQSSPSKSVTITGTGLSSAISYTTSSAAFKLSTSGWNNLTGGTLTITLDTSVSPGTYTGTITVQSGSYSVQISATGVVKDTPLSLTEKWNCSDYSGTRESKGWNAGSIRNFCYNDGKLYCVYDCDKIIVLNAQTGAYLGELGITEYITGGTFRFCDVKYIDGHIIACNLAQASKGEEFRVYAWDSDNEAPYVIYTTPNYNGATRIGDCMEVSGTWNNLTLTFANDNGTETIITDYVKDEVDNWTVKTTKLTSDGSTYFPIGNCARAHPFPGGYWVDGSAQYAGWAYSDSNTGNIINSYVYNTGITWGSIHRVFMWKTTKYCVDLVFNTVDGSTALANYYMGGRGRLSVVNSGDYSDADVICDFPANGLSNTSQNGNATGDVVVNTDNNSYVELWVCSTNQGLAYYTYGDVPSKNPPTLTATERISMQDANIIFDGNNIRCESDATITVYSATGNIAAKADRSVLSTDNLQKGIYIVKAIGSDGRQSVKKIIIK